MNGLLIALRSESFVAQRSFGSKLVILVPALIVAVQFLLVKLGQAGETARGALSGRASFDDIISNNAYGYFVDGLTTGFAVLGLLIVGQAAYNFSYERDTGAIRHLIIRRISRTSVVTAKLLHLHLLALLSILTLIATSYFLAGLLWEFGPVVEDGFELISVEEIRQEIGLGLQLAIIPIPAAIAFGLLVSVCAFSATQAVTSALAITLAVDIFKGLLGESAYYIYASFQPSLIDQSYLQDVSRLVRGYSDVLIDDRFIQLNLWSPWPALLLFFGASVWLVQRRNI